MWLVWSGDTLCPGMLLQNTLNIQYTHKQFLLIWQNMPKSKEIIKFLAIFHCNICATIHAKYVKGIQKFNCLNGKHSVNQKLFFVDTKTCCFWQYVSLSVIFFVCIVLSELLRSCCKNANGLHNRELDH